MPWILFYYSVNFRSFHFLFSTYLTHFFTNSLDCWFTVEPLFSSSFWSPTSFSLALQITFYLTFSLFPLDSFFLWWSAVYPPTTTTIYHPSTIPQPVHHPSLPSSASSSPGSSLSPSPLHVKIPGFVGLGGSWIQVLVVSGIFGAPLPQDLPLKMCYLLHLPLPAS